jgi:hypothetical protein
MEGVDHVLNIRISIYGSNCSALCDRIIQRLLDLEFLYTSAINSGAPMYPILHPVIANAFATPFTVMFFQHSWDRCNAAKVLKN